jgi:hypothetical protein
MRPIIVDKKRLPAAGLQCYLCHESNKGREQSVMGHTQQCSEPGCERRMHPTCAQDHHLLEITVSDGRFSRTRPQGSGLRLFCKDHKVTTPEPSPVKGRADDFDAAKQKGIVLLDGTVITVGDQIKACVPPFHFPAHRDTHTHTHTRTRAHTHTQTHTHTQSHTLSLTLCTARTRYWKGGRILYEGTVAGINDDETISINYHDGDYEDFVAKDRIRPSLMVSTSHTKLLMSSA